MAPALNNPNTRRAALVGLAAAAGAAIWAATRQPALPDVRARRDGDLVYLTPAGVAPSGSMPVVGLGAPDVLSPTVDRARLEEAPGAEALGTTGPAFVAFLDYRCGWCRRHAPALLGRAEQGRLRLIVREWPILGPGSTLGARAALAAGFQGAYWPFHQALMTTGFIPTEGLIDDLATRQGLEVERLFQDMDTPAVDAALAENARLARGISAQGTPTYVIDGVVVFGAYDIDTLLALSARHRLPA